MDLAKRDALVARVDECVSLEEFFDGNDDASSIWCNLDAQPEPTEVYDILSGIRDRPEVYDVLIRITQFDGGDDEWPFSDTVYFVTSAAPAEVKAWLGDAYAPDEIDIDEFGEEKGVPVPAGMHVVYGWWD